MCGAFQRGVGIAGESDGVCAAAAGFGDGGYGEGSASAGSYAYDYVLPGGFAAGHLLAAGFGVVFADFGGGGQGFGASGDDEVDAVGVECGLALYGIEGGDTAAGSGAHVDEACAIAKGVGDLIDGAGNLGQDAGYGLGDPGVFGVDQAG